MPEVMFAIGIIWWISIVLRQRETVLFRPTFFFIGSYLLQVGTGAVFSGFSWGFVSGEGYLFQILALWFPLVVLAWVSMTPGLTLRMNELSRRFQMFNKRIPLFGGSNTYRPEQILFWSSAILALVCIGLYLHEIPIEQLGIYAVMVDPANALMAREESDKLLQNFWAKNAFVFLTQVYVPVLCCMSIMMSFSRIRILDNGIRIVVIFFLICIASPSGARGLTAWAILCIGITHMVRGGRIGRGAFVITISVLLGIAIATLFSISRSGELGLADTVRVVDFVHSVVWRAFCTPYETGYLTNEFVDGVGRFGFGSVGFPFKGMLGITHVPLPNMVYNYYNPGGLESGWMNTSFLFDFQAAFGLWLGFVISFFMLIILDFTVRPFSRMNGGFCIVFYVIYLRYIVDLGSSSYSSSILGPLVRNAMLALALYWVLGPIFRSRLKRRNSNRSR
jgi:hypothetical protein